MAVVNPAANPPAALHADVSAQFSFRPKPRALDIAANPRMAPVKEEPRVRLVFMPKYMLLVHTTAPMREPTTTERSCKGGGENQPTAMPKQGCRGRNTPSAPVLHEHTFAAHLHRRQSGHPAGPARLREGGKHTIAIIAALPPSRRPLTLSGVIIEHE